MSAEHGWCKSLIQRNAVLTPHGRIIAASQINADPGIFFSELSLFPFFCLLYLFHLYLQSTRTEWKTMNPVLSIAIKSIDMLFYFGCWEVVLWKCWVAVCEMEGYDKYSSSFKQRVMTEFLTAKEDPSIENHYWKQVLYGDDYVTVSIIIAGPKKRADFYDQKWSEWSAITTSSWWTDWGHLDCSKRNAINFGISQEYVSHINWCSSM